MVQCNNMQRAGIQKKLSLKRACRAIVILIFLVVLSSSLYVTHRISRDPAITSKADIMVKEASGGAVTPVSIVLPEGIYKVMIRIPGTLGNSDTDTVTITENNNELTITLFPINETRIKPVSKQKTDAVASKPVR